MPLKTSFLSKILIKLKYRLVKVLEYNKENTGRAFYLNNKEKIDKIIFDLKSYNS